MKTTTFVDAIIRDAAGVGPRSVQVIASDGSIDRQNDIVEPAGLRLHEVAARGVPVLAQHDSAAPIARAPRVWRSGDKVLAQIDFPPEGTSQKSDEYLRLVKTGVVDTVSIGFMPHKSEPLRGGGVRFTDWSLLEISFVSVPANANAIVTAKRVGERDRMGKRLAEIRRVTGKNPADDPRYGQLRTEAVRRRRAEIRAAMARYK